MQVLTIGATGQFAGLVVPALVSRGVHVRALVHDPAKASQIEDADVEVVVGDLRDPGSMKTALHGRDEETFISPADEIPSPELGMRTVSSPVAQPKSGVSPANSAALPPKTKWSSHCSACRAKSSSTRSRRHRQDRSLRCSQRDACWAAATR